MDTNELTNSAQDTGLREDYDDIFSEEAYAERDTTGAADTDDVVALIDQVLDVDQGEPRADGEDVESTDADAGFWAEVAQRRDALIADGVEMNEAADRAWLDVCGERGIDPASTVSTAQPDESGFDSAVGEHDVDDTGIAYMAPTSPLPERAPEAGSWIARNLTYHEQADVDDENDDSDSDSDSDDDTEPPFAERVAECERAVEEVEVVVQHHERTDEDTERAERCTRWNADDAADEQADEDTEGGASERAGKSVGDGGVLAAGAGGGDLRRGRDRARPVRGRGGVRGAGEHRVDLPGDHRWSGDRGLCGDVAVVRCGAPVRVGGGDPRGRAVRVGAGDLLRRRLHRACPAGAER